MTSIEVQLTAPPLGSAAITVLHWLKHPGDPIALGEPLLIVLNDQAEFVLPAPAAGVLAHLLVPAGTMAQPGTPLSTITLDRPPALHAPTHPAAPPATPLAQRVARDLGVDLAGLAGSGPAGRVTRADVLAAARPPAAAPLTPAPGAHAPAHGAFQAGPDTYVLTAREADMSRVEQLCRQRAGDYARRGMALDQSICVARAAVATLMHYPLLNGWWDHDRVILARQVTLIYHTAGGAQLITGAQDLSLRGLVRACARAGGTAHAAATFAITCAGAWLAQPAPHGAAWLALGSVQPRAVVRPEAGAERVVMRPLLLLALSYDARMIDQAYADAFLRDLAGRVEQFSEAL
jgi:pyruvate/2-oxoglutarate dehydrogenase complex dihydrolipoamide acyltransferase (E2) component